MNLTYTVMEVIRMAFSKIGVDADNTEQKNLVDAHRNLNLMLQAWGADPDLAVGRIVPTTGYANLTDTIDLPPEYVAAISPNLAVILSDDFDQPVGKNLATQAETTLNALKIFNVRRINGRIPTNRR